VSSISDERYSWNPFDLSVSSIEMAHMCIKAVVVCIPFLDERYHMPSGYEWMGNHGPMLRTDGYLFYSVSHLCSFRSIGVRNHLD